MQVWRICKEKHLETALSGNGNVFTGGRWSPKGVKVVYTAESLALASLEYFIGIESINVPSLIALQVLIPEQNYIEEIDISFLPSDWQKTSAYPKLQAIGKGWHKSMRSPILKVPSAIIPFEYNYVLNPDHPRLSMSINQVFEFKFDPRMWKPTSH